MTRINLLVFLLLVASPSAVMAKDFASQGSSYAISEQPFIEMIEERLQSIDIKHEQAKMQARAQESVKTPKPVANIKHATRDRSFLFNQTYTLKEDIILPCGKLLHKAGTQVNPLDLMEFDRRLIFIDGADEDHISWLEQLLTSNPNEALENRVILVKGSPLQLKEELGLDIYFDQAGVLTKHFMIQAVPAIVVQEGTRLRIEERVI